MSTNEQYQYEVGPIRPPSEGYSLLLRLVRGCAWNKCKFCGFYRKEKFRVRSIEHVKRDIDAIRSWIDVFQGKTYKIPVGDEEREAYYVAANWFQSGMESVFLQDANALLMKPEQIIEVLRYLHQVFPGIKRITAYARSDTIARIDDQHLWEFAHMGLNRLHVGMETGCDELLKLVNKGVDKATQIKAGKKAMAAGIEVSEFYMPGLGGREYARQSALDTADVINQINPDFVRIRSMALSKKLDLYADYQAGIFTRTNDIDDVREIRTFIEHLHGITSVVESDHILNILLELRGKLPEDKDRLLRTIDDFLSLPEDQQMVFRLGRRLGVMGSLSDLGSELRVTRVKEVMSTYRVDHTNIDAVSNDLMINAVPIQGDED